MITGSGKKMNVHSRQNPGYSIIKIGLLLFSNIAYAQYYDDTFDVLNEGLPTEVITGSYGYSRFQYEVPADGNPSILDVRNADFTVSNSANSFPTASQDCNTGTLPVNRYPLNVYDADYTIVVGGIIYSDVPQESDWEPTYCNSAAMHFKYAPYGIVDGLRIMGAWDALRMSTDSPGLLIKNTWITDARDDALEDDNFFSTEIEDTLIDGAFQVFSVKAGGNEPQSPEKVIIKGNVIRIQQYLYKGRNQFGALFKNEAGSPLSRIYNTVVAVDYQGGQTWDSYWGRTWPKIEDCSNNLFLWMSDDPIPSDVGTPPSCFTIITGQEAIDKWEQAKTNWINCHPKVARGPNDPVSDFSKCIPNTFGGYSEGLGETKIPTPPINLF